MPLSPFSCPRFCTAGMACVPFPDRAAFAGSGSNGNRAMAVPVSLPRPAPAQSHGVRSSSSVASFATAKSLTATANSQAGSLGATTSGSQASLADSLNCPLTNQLMDDPVFIGSDGTTFEVSNKLSWSSLAQSFPHIAVEADFVSSSMGTLKVPCLQCAHTESITPGLQHQPQGVEETLGIQIGVSEVGGICLQAHLDARAVAETCYKCCMFLHAQSLTHALLQRSALVQYLKKYGTHPKTGIPVPEGCTLTPNRMVKDVIERLKDSRGQQG